MLPQSNCRYLIHDQDSKYRDHFDDLFRSVNIEPEKPPPHSSNLNAYAERFILSLRARVKSECLDRIILFGQKLFQHVLNEYTPYYHLERNHQGIGNNLVFPQPACERDSEQSI